MGQELEEFHRYYTGCSMLDAHLRLREQLQAIYCWIMSHLLTLHRNVCSHGSLIGRLIGITAGRSQMAEPIGCWCS